MKRHLKIGLFVAFLVICIAMSIALLSWNNPKLESITAILTLPALPVVFVLVQFLPPPMGESEVTSWDYFMTIVAVLVAALIWGIIAGFLSRHLGTKPHDVA